jgi:general secretion pathway protein C
MGAWLIMAVNGALFGLCCFLVATIVTEIGSEALEPVALSASPSQFEADTEAIGASPALILERNLFGAKLVSEANGPAIQIKAPLVATKLPLKLLGTAAASVIHRSRAAIENSETKKHMVVAVGDRLAGHPRVRITAIERIRVILDNAGQPEELNLDGKPSPSRVVKRPNRKTNRPDQKRQVDRKPSLNDRLKKLTGKPDVEEILSSVRIKPQYLNGKITGMRVDSIKADSVFKKIGFENGDIIKQMNGIVIDRMGSTGAVLNELATADIIETSIVRNGATLTLTAKAEQLMEQK